MEDIKRIELPVDEIIPNPDNPNEMNKKEFALLMDSIKQVGFIDPPQVIEQDDGRFMIVGGEHRWRAAVELGMKRIPVDVLMGDKWTDPDMLDFMTVRLNVLHGKMNPEKFLKVYKRACEKFGREEVAKYMGYTNEDGIKKLIGVMAKTMKESLPPEMAQQFEEEAKKAKTVGDLTNIVNRLFEEYGDTMKHNFMVFSWGAKEHVYIAMNKEVHVAMKKIMKLARKNEVDINELIGGAIREIADSIREIKD